MWGRKESRTILENAGVRAVGERSESRDGGRAKSGKKRANARANGESGTAWLREERAGQV